LKEDLIKTINPKIQRSIIDCENKLKMLVQKEASKTEQKLFQLENDI